MNIGFVGIGRMGRFMARNLAKGGHNLTVFDTHKEAAEELLSQGASWADSPSAVAAVSQVVFTALPRPQDVEAVALGDSGILNGAAPGLAYFDLSTTDPDTIHRNSCRCNPQRCPCARRPGQRWCHRCRAGDVVYYGRRRPVGLYVLRTHPWTDRRESHLLW